VDERRVRGGHHDAGDFDIRPYHVLVGQYLMRAFEMDPSRFSDGQLTVPESGNGIPDLLDEALWSLAAWEDLQNADGSIRAGVESYRHPAGIYKANADELPYWTWDPEPWHTAYVAALFAQAARLVRPYDAARSGELESAARSAYSSSVAGRSPSSYRMYAASELAALTGERGYARDFETHFASLDTWGRGAFDHMQSMTAVYPGTFDMNFAMADFVMGYAQSDVADPAVVALIEREMLARADLAASTILDSAHAHRLGRVGGSPDWGHTNSTGRHADTIYQALELGGLPPEKRQRYLNAISVAADYALGANPLSLVYLTGLGSRHVQEPLHLDSLAFAQEGRGPMPGIPVYGPVNELPRSSYYDPVRAAFSPSFDSRPLGRRYADSRTSVNTAEFTVWESQAPYAQMLSVLAPASMMPPSTWLPGGVSHSATLPEHYSE
jgi:endoglucanase